MNSARLMRMGLMDEPIGDPFGGPAYGQYQDVGSAISAGTSLVGGLLGGDSSNDAANMQNQAAQQAAAQQWAQYQKMRDDLAPYLQLGTNEIPELSAVLHGGGLNTPFGFNPTMEQLAQTPGYQFSLGQGLNTVNNQMAAKGLNLSGAQAKGLANFSQGLASTTYQQQYQNALDNYKTNYGQATDQYNRLAGLVGLGQQTGMGLGNAGLQTAQNAANLTTSGANALAAGRVGQGNAWNGALTGLGSAAQMFNMMNGSPAGGGGFYGSGGGGGSNSYGFTMPPGV